LSDIRLISTSREDMDSYTENEDGVIDHVVYIYDNPNPRIPVFAGKNKNARERANRLADSYNACRFLSTAALQAGVVEKMIKYIKGEPRSRCFRCCDVMPDGCPDCELGQIMKLLEESK